MSRRIVVISLALLTTFQFGCKLRSFNIIMSIDEQGIVSREIEISLEAQQGYDSDLSKDLMVARVAAIYGTQCESGKNWRKYKKQFAGKLPQDVEHGKFTNHGTICVEISQLGRTVAYCERMPGRTQWSEVIDGGEKSVDLIIRALVAAFENDAELQKRPDELKKLTNFLRGRFRIDVTDFLMEIWLVGAQEDVREKSLDYPSDEFGLNNAFRIGNLMVERGYVMSIRDVSLHEAECIIRALLSRMLKEMGPTAIASPPQVFKEIMGDPKAVERFIYQGLAMIGSSQDELTRLLAPIDLELFGDSTNGTVTWRTKNCPDVSNGNWDEAKGEISWNAHGINGPYPANVLWAAWSEPNEQFQRLHFRRILLRSELGEYNHWYAGLDSLNKKEWDRFLESLPGENGLDESLDSFEFSDERLRHPTTKQSKTSNFDRPRGITLLKIALDPPPSQHPKTSQPSKN